MLKDMTLALEAATRTGTNTRMAAAAAALYREFTARGGGGKDFSAIIRHLRGTGE